MIDGLPRNKQMHRLMDRKMEIGTYRTMCSMICIYLCRQR
jgi:hypothetical protein